VPACEKIVYAIKGDQPAVSVTGGALKVRHGVAQALVSCPAAHRGTNHRPAGCTGTLTLNRYLAGRSARATTARTAGIPLPPTAAIGRAQFALAAGTSRRVSVRVSFAGNRQTGDAVVSEAASRGTKRGATAQATFVKVR
jgi:hypothetical protein